MTNISLSSFFFEDLGVNLLYDILQLRADVFVVEQQCPYLDIDGIDPDCSHHCLFLGEKLVGYARTYRMDKDPNIHIGRVVVDPAHRGKNLGNLLMLYTMDQCRYLYGRGQMIELSAQTYVLEFYAQFGFETQGETYLEDGIPHQRMVGEIK